MQVARAGGITAIAALAVARVLAQSEPAPQQDSAWFDADGTARITRVASHWSASTSWSRTR